MVEDHQFLDNELKELVFFFWRESWGGLNKSLIGSLDNVYINKFAFLSPDVDA